MDRDSAASGPSGGPGPTSRSESAIQRRARPGGAPWPSRWHWHAGHSVPVSHGGSLTRRRHRAEFPAVNNCHAMARRRCRVTSTMLPRHGVRLTCLSMTIMIDSAVRVRLGVLVGPAIRIIRLTATVTGDGVIAGRRRASALQSNHGHSSGTVPRMQQTKSHWHEWSQPVLLGNFSDVNTGFRSWD